MLEAILLDDQGREVVSANIIVIRDAQSRVPLALAKAAGGGVLFLTAEQGAEFAAELKRSVFPSDLAAAESRLPGRVKRLGGS